MKKNKTFSDLKVGQTFAWFYNPDNPVIKIKPKFSKDGSQINAIYLKTGKESYFYGGNGVCRIDEWNKDLD
jgi:hypothetical protein